MLDTKQIGVSLSAQLPPVWTFTEVRAAQTAHILLHPFNLCVSDIGSVQVGEQIQHGQHWHEANIDLDPNY